MTTYNLQTIAVQRAAQQRALTKATQTLLGLCIGIIADGRLHDREVLFLSTWLSEHPEVSEFWPGSEITRRVREILADGTITQNERDQLLMVLEQITQTAFAETGAAQPDGPALPIDDDPSIFFRHMTFCFTGDFIFGTRAACERAVLSLGAMPLDGVTKKLDYLVIGSLISPQWFNTTYGRKIEKARAYKDQGVEITIVSERQWTAALADTGRAPG